MPPIAHRAPPGEDAAKVVRISLTLSWACLGAAVLVPLIVALSWLLAAPDTLDAALRTTSGAGPRGDLAWWQRPAGLALSLIPALLMSRGLWQAQHCFRRFAGGVFFDHGNVADLRGFAGNAFAATVAAMVLTPVIGMLVTWGRPAGQLTLSIGFESAQLFGLLISGTVWVMAHVMVRAIALADENASFV